MIKKLKCHCGEVEAEVKIPETGIEKFMRCNCSLCKRKGYIIGVVGAVSYTHLRAHETRHDLVCRLLLEKKKKQ